MALPHPTLLIRSKNCNILMNRFNVLITVLVCAGLCVLFGALSRSTEDATGWNPSEMYTSTLSGGSSFTNAAYSGSSNSGVALPMPSASFSSRVGAHAPYTYSASPAAGVSSQLPSGGSSAVVGHMTSSAEYYSFGGGGNAAAGSSSMARRSSSMNASPISYNALSVGSISLPTAPRSSSASNGGYTPSLAQEANYAIASSNMQGDLFDYALQTTYGTASYEDGVTSASGRKNVRGRQNAMPGLDDGWWQWLDQWIKGNGSKYGQGTLGEDGYYSDGYHLDRNEMTEAYNDFINNYWNEGMGDPPSFEDWWDWYYTYMYANGGKYTYNGHLYFWTPVGGILPLLFMALLYMIFLFVKRKKMAQL